MNLVIRSIVNGGTGLKRLGGLNLEVPNVGVILMKRYLYKWHECYFEAQTYLSSKHGWQCVESSAFADTFPGLYENRGTMAGPFCKPR